MPDLPLAPEALDLSPAFLEVAACPACHSRFALDFDSGELVCSSPSCGLAFLVRDGVPDLRLDAARKRETGQGVNAEDTEAFEPTHRHEKREQRLSTPRVTTRLTPHTTTRSCVRWLAREHAFVVTLRISTRYVERSVSGDSPGECSLSAPGLV